MGVEQVIANLPIELPLIVTEKNGKPALQFRRSVSDSDLIKRLVIAAFTKQTVVFLPTFRNQVLVLNSLQKQGIIYLDPKDGRYYFTEDKDRVS